MRAPDFWTDDGALATLLAPLGTGYDLAGRLRRALAHPASVGIPVVCVGNLVAGGAGKTPVALALIEALGARGC
ncbi:MAG: tetraacyldisaccharide 4'-kinase, partial [Proteobacteria bacterium]|nr:tetraacyldisaccharide 4'-kinase [Pseudomonadota bacterium]